MNRDEVQKNCQHMLAVINQSAAFETGYDEETGEVTTSSVDPELATQKLYKLSMCIGMSAESNAEAKRILFKKEMEVMTHLDENDAFENMPASIINRLIKARTADEIALVELTERINAGITHSMDALRSIISKYKTEMQYSS